MSSACQLSSLQIEEDIIQDEMGFSTGQLGQDTGHVRAVQSTQRKTAVTKKYQVRNMPCPSAPSVVTGGRVIAERAQQGWAVNHSWRHQYIRSGVRGLHTLPGAHKSSFRLDPHSRCAQGLEIHNPKAAEQKVAEANAKYFGKGGFDFANKRPKAQ